MSAKAMRVVSGIQPTGGLHLGNLLGIVSFIAYGLLCTVVGYFAPAPPRASAREFELGEEAAQ